MYRISVIGTGYVGLVTGACLADFGNEVICVDKIPEKIEMLNRLEIPFRLCLRQRDRCSHLAVSQWGR